VEGWAFLNAGGDRGVLAVVQSPKPQNGQRIGTKFGRPLVDCYFVHFKYLGCWCSGTVCEESDTETEPFILLGASASSSNATLRAGCVAPCWAGPTDCLRVVFTPLLLQWHSMWAKHMLMCVCRRHMWAVKALRKGEGKRKKEGGETALTNTKR
jgi:hypothetical protein